MPLTWANAAMPSRAMLSTSTSVSELPRQGQPPVAASMRWRTRSKS